MSRRRYLSTDAGRDKALLTLAQRAPLAVSFYLLAIPAAGDDGALPANDPDELLWEVWPALSRVVDGSCVEDWIALLLELELWEYAPDGRLRFPPASFYKYQTYIKDDRRCSEGRAIHPERGTAQMSAAPDTAPPAAQISANQRRTAQSGAEQRFVKASSSFSDSFSSAPNGAGAPDADAPAPPARVRAAPKPKSGVSLTPLADAFTAAGVRFPGARTGKEVGAAQVLLALGSPQDVVECWQGVLDGAYGSDFDQRRLSFAHLVGDRFFENWLLHKQGVMQTPKRARGRAQERFDAAKELQHALAAGAADHRNGPLARALSDPDQPGPDPHGRLGRMGTLEARLGLPAGDGPG